MADAKSLLHQDLVWTLIIPPARRLVWRAYGHLQLFIDCSIEKRYCGGILEKWRKVTSAFITHRI